MVCTPIEGLTGEVAGLPWSKICSRGLITFILMSAYKIYLGFFLFLLLLNEMKLNNTFL